MPPFLPRKRLSSTPPPSPRSGPSKRARLADALDAPPKPALYRKFTLGDSDSSSSLSDVDSEQFEDVSAKNRFAVKQPEHKEEEEDEDVDWEDAAAQGGLTQASDMLTVTGNIQLTFRKDEDGPDFGAGSTSTGRKGPTKREKQVRIQTHTMHVQFLLFHNAIRNAWICDKKVQKILVKQLPAQIISEVKKWRVASGLAPEEPISKPSPSSSRSKKKSKRNQTNDKEQRDWGKSSQRLEQGKADLSRGDPLIYLLKVLSAYWKKRFAITAPGLRKRGYGPKAQLKHDIQSYRNDEHDPERHGEIIKNLEEFRELANKCKGSRDVGAQLFTALLRGLGIGARLVASLQPSGYGWTKAEQMAPKNPNQASTTTAISDDMSDEDGESISVITKEKPKATQKTIPKAAWKTAKNSAMSSGNKTTPIDLDSDSEVDLSDSSSLVDVTSSLPKQRPQLYDRDVPFPIYWTEAISPVTNKVIPCSPLVISTPVATTPEVISLFEPRGAKAEKAKLVMAYVVAYSSDGSAKDVTTRYLKKHIWPGKTKGFRLPVEKITVYDKHGKVKRNEEYDWFKFAMSGYTRTDSMRTEVDDLEDSSDLLPQLPEKRKEEEGDTLNNLKLSADWVLEQHLRREEALLPNSQPDRMFNVGKGKKEVPVYYRKDVVRCLTAESWHKEGRRPKASEQPLKMVPVRAVTLTRKREAEEHQQRTGEKQMQGLYSEAQTEYIIPPPIQNGVIPKNSYGNMDCFVPSMVPKGAVHIPLKSTVRICKKLEIDFAEAVTGFEFGNKRAVPVCTGVVVAKENEKKVREAWKQWNEEQRIKEDAKAEKAAYDNWRKFIVGLRIREKVNEAYGGDGKDEDFRIENLRGRSAKDPITLDEDEDAAMPHYGEYDNSAHGGGFLLPHEDDDDEVEDLVMEHPDLSNTKGAAQYPTPNSIPSISNHMRPRSSLLRADNKESEESEMYDDQNIMDGQDDEDEDAVNLQSSKAVAESNRNLFPKHKSAPGMTDGAADEQSEASSDEMPQPETNESDPSEAESDTYPDESDSDDFKPQPRSKQKRSVPMTTQTKRRGTRTRAPRKNSKALTNTKSTLAASTRKVSPKNTPKRRSLRRNSTLVTSPYFDHESSSSSV